MKKQDKDKAEPGMMQKAQNRVIYTAKSVLHIFSNKTSSSQGKKGNLFTCTTHNIHEIKTNHFLLRGHATILGMNTRQEFLLRSSKSMV